MALAGWVARLFSQPVKFCFRCGATVPEGCSFCIACGAPINY